MKVKSFKEHLKKRLNKSDIAEIEVAAKLEKEALKTLQAEVSKAVLIYMDEKNIGFNELVSKVGKSPAQVSKIIKGEAHITLATVAHLFAMMKRKQHLIF